MKTCKVCGSSDFFISPKTGKETRCKSCMKAWRKNNYLLKKEETLNRHAEYRKNNKDKIRKSDKEYRQKNKEKISNYAKQYHANNAENIAKKTLEWQRNNPEKVRVIQQNRRARKKISGGSLSKDIIQRLYILQKGLCPCCNLPLNDDFHLDHIIPLVLGGTNEDKNVQLLRSKCNLSKNKKHPIDYMQSKGYL